MSRALVRCLSSQISPTIPTTWRGRWPVPVVRSQNAWQRPGHQPDLALVRTSAAWVVTSGSLFVDNGEGSSGPVDDRRIAAWSPT